MAEDVRFNNVAIHQSGTIFAFNFSMSVYLKLIMVTLCRLIILCCFYLATLEAWAEEEAPKKFEFTINTFAVEGESLANILSDEEISAFFKPYQNKSYDLKDLQSVSKTFEQLIRDQGYAFYRVIIPAQSLTSGEVKLKVIAFSVGNINVQGNESFSTARILDALPTLKKGTLPNTRSLASYVKVANKHPTKQLQLTFKEGETEDTIDANIKVTEQPRPYQLSLSFNNTGSDKSGEYRLSGGVQYSNLWGLDHIINASYTLPPDHADTIEQYGGTYALPIYPLKGWLNMYYAWSGTDNGVVATDLSITGAGEMMGIHYQQFLPKIEKYEHNLDIGIDSKHFINDIQFKKVQIGNNVRSLPLSISYKAEYPFEDFRSGYFIQWATNTGWGADNTNALYQKSRSSSKADWALFRYGLNLSTSFDDWIITTSLSAQYTDQPLIAGEQIGIGGSFDVRGYEQRETGADSGQIAKVELTSPAWEKFNAFVFYDYGHGSKENPLQGELKEWQLSGTGIGLKWQWQEYISSSFTFATALEDANTTHAGNNRILMNVSVRY